MNAINKKLIDAMREAWTSDRTGRVRTGFDNARGLWVDRPETQSEITDDEFVFAGLSCLARAVGLDVVEIVVPGARERLESYQKAERDVLQLMHNQVIEGVRKG